MTWQGGIPDTLRDLLGRASRRPWRAEGSIYDGMAAEIAGERGIAQVWTGETAMSDALLMVEAVNFCDALASAGRETSSVDGEVALRAEIVRLREAINGIRAVVDTALKHRGNAGKETLFLSVVHDRAVTALEGDLRKHPDTARAEAAEARLAALLGEDATVTGTTEHD